MRLVVSVLLVVLLFASCTSSSLDPEVIKEQVFAADEEVFFYTYVAQENYTIPTGEFATQRVETFETELDRERAFVYTEIRNADGLDKELLANDQLYRPTNFGTWVESSSQGTVSDYDAYQIILDYIKEPSWQEISSVRLHGADVLRIDMRYHDDLFGRVGNQSVWIDPNSYHMLQYESEAQSVGGELISKTSLRATFSDFNDRSASKQEELLRQLP